ncbi:hypothetical protein FBEOM_3790 [Fusarium beomiforme]|uniref:Uncharacterized protein n=1 Tax=Fusarium beomiforme TaxID=44412 RepID=A0A9P5APF9_9HYPO|nr:hypothetical protein FBEOM_3790 [Fusarium beomiforme]
MSNDNISSLKAMIGNNVSLFGSSVLEKAFIDLELESLRWDVSITGMCKDQEMKQKIRASTHLLCIGFPSVNDIADDDLIGVKFDITDHEILNTPLSRVIQRKDITRLQDNLGVAFVSGKGDKLSVHQAVMTTLLAGTADQVQVEFQQWSWLKDKLRKNTLVEHIHSKQTSRVLLWASNNNSLCPGMAMCQFYNHVRTVSALCGNLEVCLSETEAAWEELKIGDIKAFGEIARQADKEFSYRPKTCFGNGTCLLPRNEVECMMIKRSHSCGGAHVKRVPGSDRELLKCVDDGEGGSRRSCLINLQSPIWFHQEEITSLETYGEFRVFFVKDEIVGAVRTQFEDKEEEKNIAAQALSLSDFNWYSENTEDQKFKKSRLYAFAAYVRAHLLRRHDSRENYRSLRVAVRIDIGVSMLHPGGRFFVVEVARFAGAAFFSEFMFPKPYTQMMERIAKAMIEEYGS